MNMRREFFTGFRSEYSVVDAPAIQLSEIDFSQPVTHIQSLNAITLSNGRDSFWKGGADDNFAAQAENDPAEEPTHDDDHASDDTMDHGDHGGMAHEDDHAGHTAIPLPTTPEEIAAFVAAVRASPEMHSHDMGSSMAGEHMAAMDLVPRDEASHIAIANGAWDDPANWHNGEVPGDNATVLIPDGVHMTYDHVSDARILTVRVDGHLDFATDTDSQLIVDTLVVSPSGALTIGTETDPVDPNVDVDIIFANNGAIDTVWDPMLLSRGMIAHGEVEIHGAEKDSHDKVIDDPMAGDTWVDFGETPEGWAVGDKIVIAGTKYEGYKWGRLEDGTDGIRHYEPEDEVRIITEIADGQVFFDDPLLFDHDTPRDDLKTSVANYTRNVSFETEDADLAEVYERGHVMFMHNDDVDVRYAEFSELGRTDKSETALNVSEFASIEFDTNVKGRYSFHFHRAGVDDPEDPAMAVGNAVYGSPGWGFVHHDSNAILDNNATYDTFGAGYVAESANETGAWTDNIAIYAQGNNWNPTKLGNDLANYDLGQSGDGFWFQGRLISSVDNVAASVNHGFVYFHRGHTGEDGMIQSDADDFAFPSVMTYDETVHANVIPILSFSGNETFASRVGLEVVKANPRQDHDVHSKLEDFTAWSVKYGAFFEYTSHYTLEDFDLIGKEPTMFSDVQTGILFGTNTPDMTIVNPTISGFQTGIKLNKSVTTDNQTLEHGYNVIDATITDTGQDYASYDPTQDLVTSSADLPVFQQDISFDAPLRLLDSPDPATRGVFINGTKTDSLGVTEFPGEWENFKIDTDEAARLLEADGYYSTTDGEDYFVLDVFFSDRLTGDIYLEKHAVMIDEDVPLGNEYHAYQGAVYNGVRDLDGSMDDPTFDAAMLWATLTDGQVTLSDEALALLGLDPIHPPTETAGPPQPAAPIEISEPTFDLPDVAGSIQGSAGPEHTNGTDQDDVIFGNAGDDTIVGGFGADTLSGDGGEDLIDAGTGDDLVFGGIGFDTIHGESGDDTLIGQENADSIFGGSGDDVLIGGAGFDQLYGEDGNDMMWSGDTADRLYGGAGNDWMSAGINVGSTVDGLWGEEGNDTMFGGAGFDLLDGGDGDDVMDGGDQADNLYGRAGEDIMFGGQGLDRLFGGAGNDQLIGGSGNDGHFGEQGNDTAWGGSGEDRFFGGTGNDILMGEDGADSLYGGAGFDTLIGGADNDLLVGNFNADRFVFETNHGNDTIGDFDALNGFELMDFSKLSGLDTVDSVLAASQQVGADVLITTGANSSIWLLNVTLVDLGVDDFAF